MVLENFLIASSIQLLSVLSVAPRQTQINLLADLRMKHSLAEVITEESSVWHGQLVVLVTVAKQLFPGRITISEANMD